MGDSLINHIANVRADGNAIHVYYYTVYQQRKKKHIVIWSVALILTLSLLL